jgi:murein DD-endopeptidase MepM/ murein hydrolase activator NlpD
VKRWAIIASLLAALLLQGCNRQETATVVLSGKQPEPAASAPAASAPVPTASAPVAAPPAVVASAPESSVPEAASPPPVTADGPSSAGPGPQASQPAEPRGPDGPALLALRPLVVPVAGVPPSALIDTYTQARGTRTHEAIDIMAPRGTPVHAVDDGKLVKLFNSKPGGLTVYQFDPEGNLAYYYAHLDRYAPGLKEGMRLRRGDLIGYVGVTGNSASDAPHLHFAVFRLGPARQWWKGEPINPYFALRNAQPAR